MSVAVCHDAWAQIACMYDTTTGEAFGPVFTGPAAGEGAEEFLKWLAENGPGLREHLPGINGPVTGNGDSPRDWWQYSLARIVEHFQNTVLDTVVGHEIEGPEPDGLRMEGGRIVPTDR